MTSLTPPSEPKRFYPTRHDVRRVGATSFIAEELCSVGSTYCLGQTRASCFFCSKPACKKCSLFRMTPDLAFRARACMPCIDAGKCGPNTGGVQPVNLVTVSRAVYVRPGSYLPGGRQVVAVNKILEFEISDGTSMLAYPNDQIRVTTRSYPEVSDIFVNRPTSPDDPEMLERARLLKEGKPIPPQPSSPEQVPDETLPHTPPDPDLVPEQMSEE